MSAGPGVVELSASGLSRLGECETRWLWRPKPGTPELAKSRALDLGTAVHALVEARLRGQSWRDRLTDLASESPGWDPRFELPGPLPDAAWLAERHERMYPELPICLATELPFDLGLTGASVPVKVRGRMDALVQIDGQLWLWETKTMGKFDRLDWLGWDPQIATYLWASEQLGFEVRGVVYDAILTYRWKGERPVADSFKRLMLVPPPAFVRATMDNYLRAGERCAEIQANPGLAIKSAGRNCTYCPALADCHPYAS